MAITMKTKTRGFPNPWRHYLPLGYLLALLLTLFVGFIGYSTSKSIEDTVTQQLNQQQLILARKVSDHIQNQVSALETTLLNLKNAWELGGTGLMTQPDGIITRSLKMMGGDVLGILVLDVQGQVIFQVTDPSWNPEKIPVPPLPSLVHYLDSRLVSSRVWIGNTFQIPLRREKSNESRMATL